MIRLQAVLCDMDGTLVDTEPYWEESKLALTAEYGVPFTVEQVQDLVGRSMMITVEALQLAGVPLEADEIMHYLGAYVLRKSQEQTPWIPGAQEFLARMKHDGIPVALVTQATPIVANAMAAASDGAISLVVSGMDVTNPKPHPEPYLLAAGKLGADIRACIAIEDSPSGTQSADDAGAQVIVVPGMFPIDDSPNRHKVASLNDVTVPMMEHLLNDHSGVT